ncbi:PIN domain-containing protein [Devosia sp.]|jgi:predicted nucleic-acid-binding protein|uniref:PIN domain-containing protein n=1 Tax=Devosia sp. TaxID=1871048 RepID=UPI0037C017CC
MIGLDTNIIVRLITRDDPAQTEAADRILDHAGDEGLFISLVVLAELAWVLRKAYGFSPGVVLDSVEKVLAGREFAIERRALAEEALARARKAGCGYADALIDLVGQQAGAGKTLTFDVRAKRLPTMIDAMTYR